jgi:hypothetical protein
METFEITFGDIRSYMLPKTLKELNRIRDECYTIVTKRALVSGGAAMSPLPGVDIAADVGLLLHLLPQINRRFGLSPEQVDQYDPQMKMFIANLIIELGTKVVGQVLTKELIMQLLKLVGVRVTTKQIVKYLPWLGQLVAAGISFSALKFVGNQHVRDCYRIAKRIIEEGPTAHECAEDRNDGAAIHGRSHRITRKPQHTIATAL